MSTNHDDISITTQNGTTKPEQDNPQITVKRTPSEQRILTQQSFSLSPKKSNPPGNELI